MRSFHCLDLSSMLNHKACTTPEQKGIGGLTVVGSSIPESYLPFDQPFQYDSIPFIMMKQEMLDNIELSGQRLELPRMRALQLHVIGTSSETDMCEPIQFEFERRHVHSELLELGCFSSSHSVRNNECIIQAPYLHTRTNINERIQPKLWYTSLPLPRSVEINSILLGDNPCMHIFSLTIEVDSTSTKEV